MPPLNDFAAGYEKENSNPQSGRKLPLGVIHAKTSTNNNTRTQLPNGKRAFGTFTTNGKQMGKDSSVLEAERPSKKRTIESELELTTSKRFVQSGNSSLTRLFERESVSNSCTGWRVQKEQGLTGWLNFVLQDLHTPDETSTSTFRTLLSLRKDHQRRNSVAAVAQSDSVMQTWDKIEKEIKEGRITIRSDRNIFCDFGLRDKLLQIIFCVDTIWLRPALEVIFQSHIPRSNHHDSNNVYKFLYGKLTKNQDLQSKYDSKTSEWSISPHFFKEFNQYILGSFLRLIILLDRSKKSLAIEKNPCLFTKKTEIRCGHAVVRPVQLKSTKDMLICFSKEFLSGEGDVIRHLAVLGVSVSFQQSALEEYDHFVSNLFSDLRDGVLLARTVDLLQGKGDVLSSKLRVPAISRLQKVCFPLSACILPIFQADIITCCRSTTSGWLSRTTPQLNRLLEPRKVSLRVMKSTQ